MKVSVFNNNQEQEVDKMLYLAKHKTTGSLALINRYSIIFIEPLYSLDLIGNGFSAHQNNKEILDKYSPLPIGTKVILENTAKND